MSDCSSDTIENNEYDLRVEKTLALIKPEAVKYAPEIEDIIKKNGYDILSKRTVHLTPEQAAEFYSEHFGQIYFPNLVVRMSSTPIVALCIAKPNAITEWRRIMGPTNVLEAQAYWPNSIRACYGIRASEEDEYNNAVHGSDNHAAALREIHYFFPELVVGPVLRDWQINEYLQGNVNSTLLKGLEELCKERPDDPLVWLADWLLIHNPYCPRSLALTEESETDIVTNMSSTESTFVVGPVLRDWQINEYLQGNVNSTLLKGLEELCKERPDDPLVWLADWLLIHNPYCPRSLALTEESETDIVTNMSSTESTCS